MDEKNSSSFATLAAQIKAEFTQQAAALGGKADARSVDELRVSFLGRKGKITAMFETMKDLPDGERPAAGKAVNTLRQEIEAAIRLLQETAAQVELDRSLATSGFDISLPVDGGVANGALHPVTLMRRTLLTEFRRLGFTVYDGPEVDADFYNFSALNFSDHHPARDMHDTFFVKSPEPTVLRTHTSNIQIHAMLNEKPPLRIVAPGRTFRCDSDLTHTPMFHQIEAFIVDRGISFAHMKGVIDRFLKAVYGADCQTRLRPSYFPFVEPGAEVDMRCVICKGAGCRVCKNTGWLEIGGCGMIHPNVFEAVGYDSEEFTGFAFGFGIDRMAMLKYQLPDLRQLFAGSYSFLQQFPIYS